MFGSHNCIYIIILFSFLEYDRKRMFGRKLKEGLK
jgi:hypothetical protein